MLNGERDSLIWDRENYLSKRVVARGDRPRFWFILDSSVNFAIIPHSTNRKDF